MHHRASCFSHIYYNFFSKFTFDESTQLLLTSSAWFIINNLLVSTFTISIHILFEENFNQNIRFVHYERIMQSERLQIWRSVYRTFTFISWFVIQNWHSIRLVKTVMRNYRTVRVCYVFLQMCLAYYRGHVVGRARYN